MALNANWKIPSVYFLIKYTVEEDPNFVRDCLIQMDTTRVLMKASTSVGATSNIFMYSILGVKLNWPDIKPYLLPPKTNGKIHIIFDACHKVKLCPNTLGDWGYFYDEDNKEINWKFSTELVKIQNEFAYAN